jgi:hypothetical protein
MSSGQKGQGGQQGQGPPGQSSGYPQGGYGNQGGYQQGGQGGYQPPGGQGGWNQPQQGFGFQPNPHQNYIISSAQDADYALDASKDNKNINKLILWKVHRNPNQQWQFQAAGDGTFFIRSAESGGTLEIPEYASGNGSQPHVSQPNGTQNEKWRIVPAQGHSTGRGYSIQSAYNNLVLDITGGKMSKGTQIILYQDNHQLNQTWTITPV